LGKSFTHSCL